MIFSDPAPSWDEKYNAITAVEHLPASQAFEQVMYDHLVERRVLHTSDTPIVFKPELLQANFPKELKDCFVFTHNFTVDEFRTDHTLRRDDKGILHYTAKAAFSVNSAQYQMNLNNGLDASMSITTEHGTARTVIAPTSYTALVASILYAIECPHTGSADAVLHPDPLLFRRSDLPHDEALLEQILVTFGDFTGETTTMTTSLFPAAEASFHAELISVENPRLSGVQSALHIAPLSNDTFIDTSLEQREVNSGTQQFSHRFAEVVDIVNSSKATIFPEDKEEWSQVCLDFYSHISPLLTKYEQTEELYD